MKLTMNPSMKLTKEERGFGIGLSFLIIIGIYLLSNFGYAILYFLAMYSFTELTLHPMSNDLFNLFSFWPLLAGIILFIKYSPNRTLKSLGFHKAKLGLNLLKGFLIGAGLLGAVYVINLLIGAIATNPNSPWGFGALLLYLFLFFVQSLTEEVMCRGYLMNIIGSRIGPIWSIVLNSAFFSVLHFTNPNASLIPAVNLFIFGLVFSVLFYLTDNIWLAGAAHAAWNFVLGCIIGSPVSGLYFATSVYITFPRSTMDLYSGGVFGLEGGIICSLVGLIALAILSYLSYQKYKLSKTTNA